jgi:ribonuclease P protein component
VIWRVRDRATFEALRRHGRRARRGPVTVVHVPASQLVVLAPATATGPDPQSQVRAAYAIGRKVGNAVVRNRLRRRLRSILHELDDRAAGDDRGLAPGAYLVTVGPAAAELSYASLSRELASACTAASSPAPARDAGSNRGST